MELKIEEIEEGVKFEVVEAEPDLEEDVGPQMGGVVWCWPNIVANTSAAVCRQIIVLGYCAVLLTMSCAGAAAGPCPSSF